jgi:hypothetical protein
MSAGDSSVFWAIAAERADDYVAKGYKRRNFFPHRTYFLPKCGPDGYMLAKRMTGNDDPSAMWELVLYADPAMLTEFPQDLFFDDDLIWHRQHFGRPGQVASASLVIDGTTLYSITHVSDLVQRISRRREYKTRIEQRFGGWRHMLLNAVFVFAQQHGVQRIHTATADLARRHTDTSRLPGIGLFERIYDQPVSEVVPARRDGDWWVIESNDARDRVLMPQGRTETIGHKKTVCICHDIERGMGHIEIDPVFAKRAEQESIGALAEMREIEADLGVRSTYCVVGSLMPELRDGLESDGHALAFHSFDHRADNDDQLRRCREVDYRIKGYRPPRSKMTGELADGRHLLYRNFEWLASGWRSLGTDIPRMRAGLVRVPLIHDDFPLHTLSMSYDEWERVALGYVRDSDFVGIGLHDCYAPHWLPRYRHFLEQVGEMAELRTADEVAAEVTLCSAA